MINMLSLPLFVDMSLEIGSIETFASQKVKHKHSKVYQVNIVRRLRPLVVWSRS